MATYHAVCRAKSHRFFLDSIWWWLLFAVFFVGVPKTGQQDVHRKVEGYFIAKKDALLFTICSWSFLSVMFGAQNLRRAGRHYLVFVMFNRISRWVDKQQFLNDRISRCNLSKDLQAEEWSVKASGMAFVRVVCRKFIPKIYIQVGSFQNSKS